MIRELFLPDSLFSKSIIGIEISKHNVFACQLHQKSSLANVQKITSVAIELSNEKTHEEQTISALTQTFKKVVGGKIRISIPNNKVIFKEVTFPFLDTAKIKMILGYEIESSLPFSIHNAAFDFVVIKQDKAKKETTVLAAVTQKKHIEHYTNLINKADTKLKISEITVDLFGVYGLYSHIYSESINKYQVLLDLGKNSIAIAYMEDGKIRLIRNLPYGISNVITKITSASQKTHADVVEELLRFGISQNDNTEFSDQFKKIIHDLLFTLESFKSKIDSTVEIKNILIVESAIEIKDIAKHISNKINLDCSTMNLGAVSNCKNITIDPNTNLSPTNLPCFIAAITSKENSNFNLMPEAELNSKITSYQVITIMSFTLILFISIYSIGIAKRKDWQDTLSLYEKDTTSALNAAFPDIDASNLTDTINEAESKVRREKNLWFSFSNRSRYSFLKYLQALSSAISLKKINIDIKKLIISDNVMTIKGSAETYEDVYSLEQLLTKVSLFASVTKTQERDFTIKIVLKKSRGDRA